MIEAHGMERLGHAAKVHSSYVETHVHSSHGATPRLSSGDRDRRDLALMGKKGQLLASRKVIREDR